MNDASEMVRLANGREVPAESRLRGCKQIAAAWRLSVIRFKQLAADPLLRNLLTKTDTGRYDLTARQAMKAYALHAALVARRPDFGHDPKTGRITGKSESSFDRAELISAALVYPQPTEITDAPTESPEPLLICRVLVGALDGRPGPRSSRELADEFFRRKERHHRSRVRSC